MLGRVAGDYDYRVVVDSSSDTHQTLDTVLKHLKGSKCVVSMARTRHAGDVNALWIAPPGKKDSFEASLGAMSNLTENKPDVNADEDAGQKPRMWHVIRRAIDRSFAPRKGA